MAARKGQPRVEADEFGEVTIPAGSYWGIGTARSLEFFAPTGQKVHPALVDAIVRVKKAVAITNGDLQSIGRKESNAISQVCDEIISGQWREQFVADALNGGAGIALNINVNEVLANRAGEILGDEPDAISSVDPEKHVNFGQSLNDVYPTSMRIAILTSMGKLETTLLEMERLLRRKSLEFERIVKPGRTSLRDSVPVTLGQEFNCYGSAIERGLRRIKEAAANLEEVNLGGGHVGTGFNTNPQFGALAVLHLSRIAGINLRNTDDPFRLTQSMGDFVAFSSSLKELVVDLTKIANDLRLLSSGPAAGIGEIRLPELLKQPSTLLPGIMPQASIPPMTEQLSMICFQVLGNDHVVSLAAAAGQLESNAMTPVIIDNILRSMTMLETGLREFNRYCLNKITADAARCKDLHDSSGALIAALTSELGYQKAVDLVNQSISSGTDIKELLIDTKLMPRAALEKIFHYKYLTTPTTVNPEATAEDAPNDKG